MEKHRQHFLSFGKWDGKKRTGYYLSESQERNFKNGLYNVIGQDDDGAYIIELKSTEDKDVRPMTIWNKKHILPVSMELLILMVYFMIGVFPFRSPFMQ